MANLFIVYVEVNAGSVGTDDLQTVIGNQHEQPVQMVALQP
jgi:hypothetical protein